MYSSTDILAVTVTSICVLRDFPGNDLSEFLEDNLVVFDVHFRLGN